VHVLGASGSGTTTLARALADYWAVPHADADDYFWLPSKPPYVRKRPADERLALMRAVFAPREAWVLSGSMLGWGEAVVAECDAIIFLTLDPIERLRRLEQREERRRAGAAYDMAAWQAFLDWAKGYDDPAFSGRSRSGHEDWLLNVGKPVLQLDGAASVNELLKTFLAWDGRGSSKTSS
jgi:adenylate kinase family enzyme